MSSILILGAGCEQIPLIDKAKSLDLEVIAADGSLNAPGFCLADYSYSFNLGDTDKCISIAKKHNISGVLTLASEYVVPTIAAVAENLNLRGITVATAVSCTDKVVMRRRFSDACVPSPCSFPITSVDQAAESLKRLSEFSEYAIVKPALSSASRGVNRIPVSADIPMLGKCLEIARYHSRNNQVLLEEYVAGEEYSLECLTFRQQTHVLAITKKITTGAPNYIETGHIQPALLSDGLAYILRETAISGIRALGIDDTASHVEIRLSNQEPKIIEIAARMAGGSIASHLVRLSTGIDYLGAAIKTALGEIPNIKVRFDKGAAIRFFTPQPGTIASIRGIDDAKQMPGVVLLSFSVNAGDKVGELKDGTSRIGRIICQADTAKEALFLADRAASQISIGYVAPKNGIISK